MADGAADGIFLLGDIAAGGFQFAEDRAGAGKKSLPSFREADGTTEAVEESSAEFIFEFHDLLRKRWLRNVRLLGGAAERASLGDRAEVAKLMKFHRLCLSIVSELYIGSIAAVARSFYEACRAWLGIRWVARELRRNHGGRKKDNDDRRRAAGGRQPEFAYGGPRGPVVFEDFLLFEKMAHFNRERIPERVVHAKGSGAHGHFVCTS